MKILNFSPFKVQFNKTEKIKLQVTLDEPPAGKSVYIDYRVTELEHEVLNSKIDVSPEETLIQIAFALPEFSENYKGYRIDISLRQNGKVLSFSSTAFDRAASWQYAPRYGFLVDFSQEDENDEKDMMQMNRLHLNVVQFYDWMYRHHQFFSSDDDFIDPMGRRLSMKTIQNKLKLSHQYGMKAMAYGAVYAAQNDFFEQNRACALYDNEGHPYKLCDFISIMDPSRGGSWQKHIMKEYRQAVDFGFDGIHMDQYGFPKSAWRIHNSKRSIVHLDEEFRNLIDDTHSYLEESCGHAFLIFNAVNNWPVEKTADTLQDAIYIEVWPPNDTYDDLYNLIKHAKLHCSSKQVILAAYMKPFDNGCHTDIAHARSAAFITMATIFASGGFHLLLGENGGILMDPYYANYYRETDENFIAEIRDYYDFITAYEEILFDLCIEDRTMTLTGGINTEFQFRCHDEKVRFSDRPMHGAIWNLIKVKDKMVIIQLVNYINAQNDKWNEEKAEPVAVNNIEVLALIMEQIQGVYLASPDFKNGEAAKLPFEYVLTDNGKAIRFVVPTLKRWNVLYIKTE